MPMDQHQQLLYTSPSSYDGLGDDDHRIPHPTTHTVGLEASAFAGVHGRGFPCSFNDVIQHSHWLVGILSYKSRGLPYVICHAYGNEVSSL